MRAAVKTRAARKESVAVCNLTNVLVGASCGNDGTGTAVLPEVNVVLSIEGNDAAAGSTRGRLNSYAVLKGLREKSVGVGVAEVAFGKEGELVKVLDALNIVGGNSLLVHKCPIVGYVFVNVTNLLHELFRLKLFKPSRFYPIVNKTIATCTGFSSCSSACY